MPGRLNYGDIIAARRAARDLQGVNKQRMYDNAFRRTGVVKDSDPYAPEKRGELPYVPVQPPGPRYEPPTGADKYGRPGQYKQRPPGLGGRYPGNSAEPIMRKLAGLIGNRVGQGGVRQMPPINRGPFNPQRVNPGAGMKFNPREPIQRMPLGPGTRGGMPMPNRPGMPQKAFPGRMNPNLRRAVLMRLLKKRSKQLRPSPQQRSLL